MSKRSRAERAAEQEATYPTPAEVERMCAEIQSHWSARDRRRRAVSQPGSWSAPTIRVAEISRDRVSGWPSTF